MNRAICSQHSLVMLLCQQLLCSRSKWQTPRQHESMLCTCARWHSTESESCTKIVNKISEEHQDSVTVTSVKCAVQDESKEQQQSLDKKGEHTHEQHYSQTNVKNDHNEYNNSDYDDDEEEDKRYVPQWFNKQVRLGEDEFASRPITEQDIFPRGRWYGRKTMSKQREDVKQSEKKSSSSSNSRGKPRQDIFNFEREDMYDRYARAQEEEAHARDAVMGKSNEELFPNWAPDEEAPREEFMQLDPSLQTQYIYNRLSMAERRIRLAPDFGATGLAVYLYYGDMMLRECESLLNELGWMTKLLQSRINELKALSLNHKIENDLL